LENGSFTSATLSITTYDVVSRQHFPQGLLPCPAGNSGVVPNADPRPAAMAWKDDERFAVQAANVGLDIILCPAHFLYLDIVQDLNFEDKLLARNRQIDKFL